MDRIDIFIEVPPVEVSALALPEAKEGNEEVRERVLHARKIQQKDFPAQNIRSTPSSLMICLKLFSSPTAKARRGLKSRRKMGSVGARLSPRFAGRAHHRRSGRKRDDLQTAYR